MTKTKPDGFWKSLDNVLAEARRIMQKEGWTTIPATGVLVEHRYRGFLNGVFKFGGLAAIRDMLGLKAPEKDFDKWKSLESMLEETRQIMRREGWESLPTTTELLEKGQHTLLYAASKYHGGLTRIREHLGQKVLRKVRPEFKDINFVLKCAKEAMEKEGWEFLPSGNDLRKKGYVSLDGAIGRHHGGIQKVRKLLGQDISLKKDTGYWTSVDNIVAEAKTAMKQMGWSQLPTEDVLRDNGFSPIANAAKYVGGICRLREILGQENSQRPRLLWKDRDYAVSQAKEIMEKECWEQLPNANTLQEKGYSALVHAISRHHGGFSRFRALLGEKLLEREKNYWKNRKNILAFAREIMRKEGWKELPFQKTLAEKGYSSFISGATNYHGGLTGLRKLLGHSQPRQPLDDFITKEAAIAECKMIMEKEKWEKLPSQNVLESKGYGYIVRALAKHHGGINKFRNEIGQGYSRTPSEIYKNPEYMISTARQIMQKEKWSDWPGTQILEEKGYGAFTAAIQKFYGALKFREMLGFPPLRRAPGSWKSLDYTISQVIAIMEKEGWKELPGSGVLEEKRYSSLTMAIGKYHGGFAAFRQVLSERIGVNPDREKLEGLLKRYVNEN